MDTKPHLGEDNRLSMSLDNGSRVVALPGDSDTIRGFSSPALIIEDEAAYVDDGLYRAIRPMLAVSGGRLILLSTPNGRRGHFFESWQGDETWERIFRVQQNTLEQLIVFVPATVIFSTYLSARWVLIPGLIFIVGRQLYSHEYISKPESRVPGMSLSLLANAVLIIGGVVGLAMKTM